MIAPCKGSYPGKNPIMLEYLLQRSPQLLPEAFARIARGNYRQLPCMLLGTDAVLRIATGTGRGKLYDLFSPLGPQHRVSSPEAELRSQDFCLVLGPL